MALANEFQVPSTVASLLSSSTCKRGCFASNQFCSPFMILYFLSESNRQPNLINRTRPLIFCIQHTPAFLRRPQPVESAATCPERKAAFAVVGSRSSCPLASPPKQLYANYNGAAAAGPGLRHMTLWAVVRIAIYFSGASPERVDMFQV